MSGTSPTAPLYATPLVAGSPGCSGVAPGYTVLKTLGNCVPGRPLAMSVSPDNGPKENRYVCVPSPMVAQPSPPEICWHLIAPFTFELGTRYPLAGLVVFVDVNPVGPV